MSRKNKKSRAERADIHKLYEKSVQNVDHEIDTVDQIFLDLKGYHASILREDFCGTAKASCEWVTRRDTNYAYCVDIDPSVLDWAVKHNITQLDTAQKERVDLRCEDVLNLTEDKAQIILAMNFSYQIFKTRDRLRHYFTRVYENLSNDGVLILDSYGGYESCKTIKEKTKHKKFTYIWEQYAYNPLNAHILCYIHFKFKDGSKIKKAFTYDWRLWTVAEIREILLEAGFKSTKVYCEGTDEESGEGDGIFTATEVATDDPSWIAYLSAEK